MQTLVAEHAGTIRTITGVLRLGFETRYSSGARTVLGKVSTEVLSQSMLSSSKNEQVPPLLDGRINFRARKKIQVSVQQSVEVACSSDRCGLQGEQLEVGISPTSSISLLSAGTKSCPGDDATSEKIPTKRGANLRSVESSDSHYAERRVTRRRKAVSSPTGLTKESTLTSVDGSSASTVDFWHSSLSEDAVNPPVASIILCKTMLAREDLAVAIQHLKRADSRLRTVIEMHDGPKFEKCRSAFTALVRSIVFQQLATKAASTIFGRVVVLCGGVDNLHPVTISELTKQQLRAVGISERKASYLHDLAAHFLSGSLSDVSINEMDDEDLMKALTAVKGIGVWSVHMFMLFSLHRPDVLPVGDLGVRKGFQKLYQLKALPSPAEMEKLSSCWQPYRSIGSWYMWRVLDMTLPF